MSSLLRFIPAGARKWVFIGFALLLVGGILARVFSGASLSKGIFIIGLVALLAIAAIWVLIHLASKASRKRKQRTFDASLAAKEGIEDRKREWQSWVQELEKADIDRYELPFYLLLGEPQSGKSILLQNSDLHFLFGQNRLSGVGGTRGCDWWFTQEAVILDLAGRLFTHEGGAADEAEWEAFLDLLNSFRPMDPANGIMLVIPCDSLLADSIETSRKKASQIREALFTLSRKIQAKLPIYVILTKGDKIFGFAESVHRLETEQRKQMFGWSRPLDRLEHPFQSEELGEAWDGFVANASSLRDSMLATARIPEAIPEVDRMMAFPSELRGMYLAVEAYMTRIFQGSDLLDQLYFRGIYLTSGLQSGAPIAKVGLEILDRPGDADNRDLETLFVRQQAYFIRDLVRRRVFAERGLVRPTGARTKRVQKNAWIGYGVAAGFALLAAGWCAISFVKSRKEAKREFFKPAIQAGEHYTKDEGIQELAGLSSQGDILAALERLDSVNEAISISREAEDAFGRTEGIYKSRTPELEQLNGTLMETLFSPSLQGSAARALKERFQSASTPMTAETFVRDAEAAAILKDGFQSRGEAAHILSVIPAGDTSAPAVAKLLDKALPEDASTAPCTDASLGDARQAIDARWAGLTTANSPLCLDEPLRTFVVLFEVQQLRETIDRWDIEIISEDKVAAACASLRESIEVARSINGDTASRSETKDVDLIAEFLETDYPHIKEIRGRLREGEGLAEETRLDTFVAFLQSAMKSFQTETGTDASIAELKKARRQASDLAKNVPLGKVINGNWGGEAEDASIASFTAALTAAETACKTPADSGDKPLPMEVRIARAKTRIFAKEFVQQNGDWTAFADHASGITDAPETTWQTSSAALMDVVAPIDALQKNPASSPMGIGKLVAKIESLAATGLTAGNRLLAAKSGTLDTGLSKALLAHRKAFPNARQAGSTDPVLTHATQVLADMGKKWDTDAEDNIVQAGEIAEWTVAHIEALTGLKGPKLAPLDDAALKKHVTQVENRAYEAIDKELSKSLFESCQSAAQAKAKELRSYPPESGVRDALVKLTGDKDPEVFDTWFDGVVASKGLDFANLAKLSQLAAKIDAGNPVLQELTELVESCKDLTKRSNNDRNVDGLIKTLRGELRTLDAVKSTSERATALVTLAEADKLTDKSIESLFGAALREELILNQQRVLKVDYRAALAKKVSREKTDIATLWGTVNDPGAALQLSALNNIFGTGAGWYPELHSSFRLGSLRKKDLDFRGELMDGEELSDEDDKLMTLDSFLEDLAIYLADSDGEIVIDADGKEEPMFMAGESSPRHGFTLTPSRELLSSTNDDWSSTMGGWRNFSGFVSSAFVERVQAVSAGGDPIFETKPFESWAYGTIPGIQMTFSPSERSDIKKRINWETSSPLAPLHFYWLAGTNSVEGKVLTETDALFLLTLRDDIKVEFKVSFRTAPPERPRRRDTPLGD